MTQTAGDRWAVGDAYDAYMGRWSRLVAREFVDWLKAEPTLHWLEIGCGTGALTSSICARCEPASIVASDQSASFVEGARKNLPDSRVSYVTAAAEALPSRTGGFDTIVSGLVLNFIPDPSSVVASLRKHVRRGGIVAAYVWDYAGGVDFLRHFWEEAVRFDPGAATLDESRRFGAWGQSYLTSLFEAAELVGIESAVLTIPTTFTSFDDYWSPFLGGTGPAPSYVTSLAQPQRDLLAEQLRARLPFTLDGKLLLLARALAVRGIRP